MSWWQTSKYYSSTPPGPVPVIPWSDLILGFLTQKFYVDLKPFLQKQSSCYLNSLLMSEADLGYQHDPVLTEGDLLCIQDAYHCKNIFKTNLHIKVEQIGNTVIYKFKTVMDVNLFLFEKSVSAKTRSLGQLRMNVVPKSLVPDHKGFYKLVTTDVSRSAKLERSQKFTTSQVVREGKDVPGMVFLLFLTKLDLFEYLVSKVAFGLDRLQFDGSSITCEILK